MPRYSEIADDLRRRIEAGEFEVGSKLPSISELMDEYGVPGLNTVRQAQAVLISEGLLEAQQGVGVFVISTAVGTRLDLPTELRSIRASLDRLIAQIEREGRG